MPSAPRSWAGTGLPGATAAAQPAKGLGLGGQGRREEQAGLKDRRSRHLGHRPGGHQSTAEGSGCREALATGPGCTHTHRQAHGRTPWAHTHTPGRTSGASHCSLGVTSPDSAPGPPGPGLAWIVSPQDSAADPVTGTPGPPGRGPAASALGTPHPAELTYMPHHPSLGPAQTPRTPTQSDRGLSSRCSPALGPVPPPSTRLRA